jgi:hypothetical protein
VSCHRIKRRLGATGAVLAAVSLSSCGAGGLSASSTCQDFMNASAQNQQSIIDKLASQYNKPDYTSPLGAPEVPFYCSSHPTVTLGQFFANAG